MKHTEVYGPTKVVEVTVQLTVRADVDVQEMISEMDYTFIHGNNIVDTEIIDHQERESQ